MIKIKLFYLNTIKIRLKINNEEFMIKYNLEIIVRKIKYGNYKHIVYDINRLNKYLILIFIFKIFLKIIFCCIKIMFKCFK